VVSRPRLPSQSEPNQAGFTDLPPKSLAASVALPCGSTIDMDWRLATGYNPSVVSPAQLASAYTKKPTISLNRTLLDVGVPVP